MSQLKPCPFCGETPELPDGFGSQYEIECNCGMARSCVQISDLMTIDERSEPDAFETKYRFQEKYIDRAKNEAILNWNTRAQRDELLTMIVSLREMSSIASKEMTTNRGDFIDWFEKAEAIAKAVQP